MTLRNHVDAGREDGDSQPLTDRVKDAIRDLENRRGRLTAEQYVEIAKNPRSPLHKTLPWNDKAAAHQHRLERARHILRRYRFMIEVENVKLIVPRYVRDPEAEDDGVQGYVSMERIATEPENATALVAYELRRARSVLERALAIGKVLAVRKDLKRVLDQVVELLGKVS